MLRLPLAGLVIAALVAGCGGSESEGVISKLCDDVADIGPTGDDPADAVDLVATGVSCPEATGLVYGFVRARIAAPGEPVPLGRFTCEDEYPDVTCRTTDGKRVTFSYG